jgi:SAM-dependent methyltransferase
LKLRFDVLIRKIVVSIREDGLLGSLKKALLYLLPTRVVDDFDSRYGTDTATVLPLWRLANRSPNLKYGYRYQASPENNLETVMEFIGQPASRFAFVDLGSGKGRTLIIATKLGFRSVTGVEFAQELVRIAKKNLAIVENTEAVTLCMDVTRLCQR